MVSLSPVTNPDHNPNAVRLLRGLGRALGIAIGTGCPLGVALSPAFCKLLRGEPEKVEWNDLQAVSRIAMLTFSRIPSLAFEVRALNLPCVVNSALLDRSHSCASGFLKQFFFPSSFTLYVHCLRGFLSLPLSPSSIPIAVSLLAVARRKRKRGYHDRCVTTPIIVGTPKPAVLVAPAVPR
jgi:hypothetical protein